MFACLLHCTVVVLRLYSKYFLENVQIITITVNICHS